MPENPTKTEPELVSVKGVLEHFGMPRPTLYGLIKRGKIPVHRQQQEAWHTRERYLFSIPEVEAALKGFAAKSHRNTTNNTKGGKRRG
jgi:hypothetical protein